MFIYDQSIIQEPINHIEKSQNSAKTAKDYNNKNNDLADAFGIGSARRQREWETEMANSAYQRAVADLKKAGLNPALAYSNTADTPTGGISPNNSLGSIINSAANMINVVKKSSENYKDKNIINTALKLLNMFN